MTPASSRKLPLWLLLAAGISTIFLAVITRLPVVEKTGKFTQKKDERRIDRIEAHNAALDQKPDTEPLWVLAGQVDIRDGSPQYWFGDIGAEGRTPVMYPLDREGISHGTIYMARGNSIEKLGNLDQLVNRYRIYLAYYADTTAGDAYGVVRTVKTAKDTVTVELLEDPLKTQYNIPATTPLEVFDSSKLFDLMPGVASDLTEGDMVRLTVVPEPNATTLRVTKAVREAPRIKLFFGTITRITRPDKDSLLLTLDSTPAQFTADRETLVYKTSNPPPAGKENFRSRNLGFRAIAEGANITLTVYLNADHWQIVTLAIR